jgi:hypothetical protein
MMAVILLIPESDPLRAIGYKSIDDMVQAHAQQSNADFFQGISLQEK